jgi:uncharacterized membrane protein YbhN (UPF0104 family)
VSLRGLALAILSLVLAVALLVALARHAAIDGPSVIHVLARTRPERVLVLGALAGLLAFLSAERWRMIEARMREKAPPSHLRAFALTAAGVGLGQLLPLQISTSISRTLGARLLRPAASSRPVIVTLYEQSFDVGVALLLAAASGVYFISERRIPWLLAAGPCLLVGYLLAGRAAQVLGMVCAAAGRRGRLGAWMAGVADSELFCDALARRLMLVSVLRFCVTALMAGVTSWAAGLDVGLPQLAMSLPLVVLATAVPLTPSGLGVNEWTFASMLSLLGVAPAVAAQWALVNRILVLTVSTALGLLAIPLLAADSRRGAPASASFKASADRN